MEKGTRFEILSLENLAGRPKPSRVLAESREQNRRFFSTLDPGLKVQAAFDLSLEARRLSIAGLKAQGFSEEEMRAALKARTR